MSFKQLGLIIREVDNGYIVKYHGESEYIVKEKIFFSAGQAIEFIRDELSKAYLQMALPPAAKGEEAADDLPF